MTSEMERRKQVRVTARWPVILMTDQGIIEGVSRNITAEGIFIHCDEPLIMNKIYRISIMTPGKKPVEVVGKVAWSNADSTDGKNPTYGMGFSFLKISNQSRNLINDLIATHPEHHAVPKKNPPTKTR
jgi:hypothetical protein